jgi:hypothetical protein
MTVERRLSPIPPRDDNQDFVLRSPHRDRSETLARYPRRRRPVEWTGPA